MVREEDSGRLVLVEEFADSGQNGQNGQCLDEAEVLEGTILTGRERWALEPSLAE